MSARVNPNVSTKRIGSHKRPELHQFQGSHRTEPQRVTSEFPFPRIKSFFDCVDYVIERATHSVLNSKLLFIVLLGFFILVLEVYLFFKLILTR